ncbi:MAG TPA: dihydropteroate synthase [Solirubrobacterales bacterium]|nr:dihydropteroate synthase [Solirubrobacterales bacterium]
MKVMGIVNVTPDSFSDGGLFLDADKAIAHGLELAAAGADVLDIGGESTRPGAAEVSTEEELARVVPVIEGLAGSAPISIDTTKATVAEAAIEAGATIVNDVSGLRGDPDMTALCAERGVEVVIMHMLGTPRTMQNDPRYDDVVNEVLGFLLDRAESATRAGIERDRIWIDPGIGFGKTVEHNLALLAATGEFAATGLPVLLGPSRKTFIGKIDGSREDQRLGGTIAACLEGMRRGAAMVRVHDVAAVAQAIRVARAIEN